MSKALQPLSPDRIEIYVDGSWLSSGNRNPANAGGWGAVIRCFAHNVEISNQVFSGPVDDVVIMNHGRQGSWDAEFYGIYQSILRAQKMIGKNKPEIILYSDWIAATRDMDDHCALYPEVAQLKQLADNMGVTFVRATDSKLRPSDRPTDNPQMKEVHDLAKTAAWQSRLVKQGFVFLENFRYSSDKELTDALRGYPARPRGPSSQRGL